MKKYIIVLLSIAISYGLLVFSSEKFTFIDSIIVPYMAIISGVIITSISTILGNINSLFALIRIKAEALEKDNPKKEGIEEIVNQVETFLENVIIEIRQNSMLIIVSCLIVILLRLLISIDIPFIVFPVSSKYFNKTLAIEVSVLSLTILSTVAMIDTLKCFFNINDHFKLLK